MSIYEVTTPVAGIACTAGTEYWTSYIPPNGGGVLVTHGLLEAALCGDDMSINSKPMRVRIVEVDTDGSTGSAATARCISDARVNSGVPTGKHSETGTTTQIPNGNLRTLHDRRYAPGAPIEIRLYDPQTGDPLPITPGKVIAVGVTPDATGAATNNVQVTIVGKNI